MEALTAAGITPGPLYKKIKSGENIKLENGKIVASKKNLSKLFKNLFLFYLKLEASNFIGPSKPGKKITILGDCYNVPEKSIEIAENSDLLVHECTLEDNFKEKAISNGHSTPSMAAEVANRTNSKCLILNHFSQRYKPLNYFIERNIDPENMESDSEIDWVQKLVNEAKKTFNGQCIAAEDLFSYKI